MQIRELKIPGAWEITPKQFPDDCGAFLGAYELSMLKKAVDHRLNLRQANVSVSKTGVVHGIHFTSIPPSQAKYVVCPRRAVLDSAIDIRVGLPTFGQWDLVLLDDVDRRAIYLLEGLGHVLIALEDDSIVMYMCSAEYVPGREHDVPPVCPKTTLDSPKAGRDGSPLKLLLFGKDMAAPNLAEARESGLLPTWDVVQAYLMTL